MQPAKQRPGQATWVPRLVAVQQLLRIEQDGAFAGLVNGATAGKGSRGDMYQAAAASGTDVDVGSAALEDQEGDELEVARAEAGSLALGSQAVPSGRRGRGRGASHHVANLSPR